jgi:hypothetical protein
MSRAVACKHKCLHAGHQGLQGAGEKGQWNKNITSDPKLEALERNGVELEGRQKREFLSRTRSDKTPDRTTAETNEPDDGHETHSSKAMRALTVTVIMFKLWSVKNDRQMKC